MGNKNLLFLKKKDFEINQIKKEINGLNEKARLLKIIIKENELKFKTRDEKDFKKPIINMIKEQFLSQLLNENHSLKKEMEDILLKIEQKKETLAILLSEKRAFEKFLEKKEKIKRVKEDYKEDRLANEIFNRKFINN